MIDRLAAIGTFIVNAAFAVAAIYIFAVYLFTALGVASVILPV